MENYDTYEVHFKPSLPSDPIKCKFDFIKDGENKLKDIREAADRYGYTYPITKVIRIK